MSHIAGTRKRRTWKRSTYFWVLSVAAVVCALIYWEQTALLYVLSTLAMCILLLMVAFADLKDSDTLLEDRQARGDRIEGDLTSQPSATVLTEPEAIEKRKGAA